MPSSDSSEREPVPLTDSPEGEPFPLTDFSNSEPPSLAVSFESEPSPLEGVSGEFLRVTESYLDTPEVCPIIYDYGFIGSIPLDFNQVNPKAAYLSEGSSSEMRRRRLSTQEVLDPLVRRLPKTEEESQALIKTFFDDVYPFLTLFGAFDWFVSQLEPLRAYLFAKGERDMEFLAANLLKILRFYAIYFPVMAAATRAKFGAHNANTSARLVARYVAAFDKLEQFGTFESSAQRISLLLGRVVIERTAPGVDTNCYFQIMDLAELLNLKEVILPKTSGISRSDYCLLLCRGLWAELLALDVSIAQRRYLPEGIQCGVLRVRIPNESTLREGQNVINFSYLAANVRHDFIMAVHSFLSLANALTRSLLFDDDERYEALTSDRLDFQEYHEGVLEKLEKVSENPPTLKVDLKLIKYVRHFYQIYVDPFWLWYQLESLPREYPSTSPVDAVTNPHVGHTSLTAVEVSGTRCGLIFAETTPPCFKVPANATDLQVEGDENDLVPLAIRTLTNFRDYFKLDDYDWTVEQLFPNYPLAVLLLAVVRRFEARMMTANEWNFYKTTLGSVLDHINHPHFFQDEENKEMAKAFLMAWQLLARRFSKCEFFLEADCDVTHYFDLDQGFRLELLREYKQVLDHIMIWITPDSRVSKDLDCLGLKLIMQHFYAKFM